MRFRLIRWAVTASLLATSLAGPVRADATESIVAVWNGHAARALMNLSSAAVPGAGQPPTVGVIHLAMVQGAVYEAVNAIVGGYEPYLGGVSAQSATASQDAAVATAAHHVLVGLEPPLPASTLAWLESAYTTSMSTISANEDAADVAAGVEVGGEAATEMLGARADDGRYPSTPFNFRESDAAGSWRRTATVAPFTDPFAWVANVEPFVVNSASQFQSDGPLALTSAAYTAEYNEVKALGAKDGSTRTQAQTDLAFFYVPNPVEMYNRTLRSIADAQSLGVADEARLFAMINMSGADGLISCWADKELWSFWRPVTAIHEDDGNPNTEPDPSWKPFIPPSNVTPPYPDHPSGYNCLTSSVMHTAADFFGTNRMEFTVHRAPVTGAPSREYARFTDVIKDTIDARVYSGLHFRTADVQGAVMGKKVAQWLHKHYFHAVD